LSYSFFDYFVDGCQPLVALVECVSCFRCEVVGSFFPRPLELPEGFLDGAKVHGVLEVACWRKC
jgi:hypothetical protein